MKTKKRRLSSKEYYRNKRLTFLFMLLGILFFFGIMIPLVLGMEILAIVLPLVSLTLFLITSIFIIRFERMF